MSVSSTFFRLLSLANMKITWKSNMTREIKRWRWKTIKMHLLFQCYYLKSQSKERWLPRVRWSKLCKPCQVAISKLLNNRSIHCIHCHLIAIYQRCRNHPWWNVFTNSLKLRIRSFAIRKNCDTKNKINIHTSFPTTQTRTEIIGSDLFPSLWFFQTLRTDKTSYDNPGAKRNYRRKKDSTHKQRITTIF